MKFPLIIMNIRNSKKYVVSVAVTRLPKVPDF